jgi:hypothetical protein
LPPTYRASKSSTMIAAAMSSMIAAAGGMCT